MEDDNEGLEDTDAAADVVDMCEEEADCVAVKRFSPAEPPPTVGILATAGF